MLLHSYLLLFCQQLSVNYHGGKCHNSLLQMGIPRCGEEKVFALMPVRRTVPSVTAGSKSVTSI